MLARVRAALVLLLLVAAGSVGVVTPAWAASCPSPYNYQYVIDAVTLAQSSATSYTGTTLTLTGTVTGRGTDGQSLSGVCVSLSFSGANAMPDQTPAVDSKGNFTFQYNGTNAGLDTIVVTAPSDAQGVTHSARVQHKWVAKATASPTPSPTKSSPSPKPSPTPSAAATPSPSPKATASPTPSPTTSATATPTPTASPSPSPVPVPAGTPFSNGSLQLDRPSALPGGSATLHGRNCPPGSAVTYTVEGTSAGSSTVGTDGTFTGTVQLPDASIGQHLIQVTCAGQTATVPIDLVVSSSSTSSPGAGATTAAVLVFFVLLGSVLFARHQGTTTPDTTTPEVPTVDES